MAGHQDGQNVWIACSNLSEGLEAGDAREPLVEDQAARRLTLVALKQGFARRLSLYGEALEIEGESECPPNGVVVLHDANKGRARLKALVHNDRTPQSSTL